MDFPLDHLKALHINIQTKIRDKLLPLQSSMAEVRGPRGGSVEQFAPFLFVLDNFLDFPNAQVCIPGIRCLEQ